MNVDSSSLLPGSEFRDAPSDHVCKLESVKPFFFPLCSMKRNCNFNIDPKNVRVPKPPKLSPAVPMGSCAAAAGPAKPLHGILVGVQVPRSWQRGAWSLWELDTSRREVTTTAGNVSAQRNPLPCDKCPPTSTKINYFLFKSVPTVPLVFVIG